MDNFNTFETQPLSRMIDVSNLIFRGKALDSGYVDKFVLQDIIKQSGSLKIGDEYRIHQQPAKYIVPSFLFRENKEYVVFMSGAKADINEGVVPGSQKNWFPQAVFTIYRDSSIVSVSNGKPVTELTAGDFNDDGRMICAPVLLDAIPGMPEHIELGSFIESVRMSVNSPCLDRDIWDESKLRYMYPTHQQESPLVLGFQSLLDSPVLAASCLMVDFKQIRGLRGS